MLQFIHLLQDALRIYHKIWFQTFLTFFKLAIELKNSDKLIDNLYCFLDFYLVTH